MDNKSPMTSIQWQLKVDRVKAALPDEKYLCQVHRKKSTKQRNNENSERKRSGFEQNVLRLLPRPFTLEILI